MITEQFRPTFNNHIDILINIIDILCSNYINFALINLCYFANIMRLSNNNIPAID